MNNTMQYGLNKSTVIKVDFARSKSKLTLVTELVNYEEEYVTHNSSTSSYHP